MMQNNNSYEVSEARVFFIFPVLVFLGAAGLIVIALTLGVDPDELRLVLIIALVLALLGALTVYELVHRRLRILYPGQTYCYYPFLGGAKHFTRYDIARVVIGFSAARGEYVKLLGHAEETICTLETNMANIMVFVKEMMECGVPIEDNTAYTGRILQQPRTMPDAAYAGEDLRTEGEGRYVKEPEAPRNTTRSGRAVIIIGGIVFLAALGATAFLRVQDVARLDREGRELQITSRREAEEEEENINVADLDEETLRWIYAANAMVYDEAFDPFFIGGLDPEKEGNVRRMQRELESAWGWKNYDPDMTTASFEELYEAGVYLRASHCREEWDAAGIDFPSFQETRLTDAVRE